MNGTSSGVERLNTAYNSGQISETAYNAAMAKLNASSSSVTPSSSGGSSNTGNHENSAYWSTQSSNTSSTSSTSYPASSNGYVPTGNIQTVDYEAIRRAEAAKEMKQIQDDYADLKQGEKQIGSTLDKFVVNGASIGKHTYKGEAAAAHSKVQLPTDTSEYTDAINSVADDLERTEELQRKVAEFGTKYGDLDIDEGELGGIHSELDKKVEEAQDVIDDLKGTRDKIDEINQRQANLFSGSKSVKSNLSVNGDKSKVNLGNGNQTVHFGDHGKEIAREVAPANTYTVTFPDGSKVTVDTLEKANAAIAAEGGLGSVYYNGENGDSTHVADGGGGTGRLNIGGNPSMNEQPQDEYFQKDRTRYYAKEAAWKAQEQGKKLTDKINKEVSEYKKLFDDFNNYIADIDKYKENPKNGFALWLSEHKYSMEDFAESKFAEKFGYNTPEEALEAFVAVVISESNKTPEDVLAITSVILNRCDLYPNWVDRHGTSNPFDQLFYVDDDNTPEFQAIVRTEEGTDDWNGIPRYKKYMPSYNENGEDGVNELIAAKQNKLTGNGKTLDEEGKLNRYNYAELRDVVYDALFAGVRNNVYSCYYSEWNHETSPDSQWIYVENNNYMNNYDNPIELSLCTDYQEQLRSGGQSSYNLTELNSSDSKSEPIKSASGRKIIRINTHENEKQDAAL